MRVQHLLSSSASCVAALASRSSLSLDAVVCSSPRSITSDSCACTDHAHTMHTACTRRASTPPSCVRAALHARQDRCGARHVGTPTLQAVPVAEQARLLRRTAVGVGGVSTRLVQERLQLPSSLGEILTVEQACGDLKPQMHWLGLSFLGRALIVGSAVPSRWQRRQRSRRRILARWPRRTSPPQRRGATPRRRRRSWSLIAL